MAFFSTSGLLLCLGISICHGTVPVKPIGIWPMSQARGRDMSGSHNHGKPTGLVYQDGVSGIPDTAADFNGADVTVSIPQLQGLTAPTFSVCAVVNMGEAPQSPTPVFSFQDKAGTSVFELSLTQLFRLKYEFTAPQKSYKSYGVTLSKNTWTFVGMSYNSVTGSGRMWLNDTAIELSSIGKNLLATPRGAMIGSTKSGTGSIVSFKGTIACVVLYGSVLSLSDIITAWGTCTRFDNNAIFSPVGRGHLPTGAVIGKPLSSRSEVECSSQCFSEPSCKSCSFSADNKMCQLGSLVMDASKLTPTGDYKTHNIGADI